VNFFDISSFWDQSTITRAITKDFIAIPILWGDRIAGNWWIVTPQRIVYEKINQILKGLKKELENNLFSGSSNKLAILPTNIELRTYMAEQFHFLKDTFTIHKKIARQNSNLEKCQPHQKSMKSINALCHDYYPSLEEVFKEVLVAILYKI
jgi:hypothetical protein